jgi:hypothetical protein
MLAVTAPHIPIPRPAFPEEDPLQSRVAADKAPGVCAAAAESLGVLASEHHRFARASGMGEGQEPRQINVCAHWDAARNAAGNWTLLLLLHTRVEFFRGGCLKEPGLKVYFAEASQRFP